MSTHDCRRTWLELGLKEGVHCSAVHLRCWGVLELNSAIPWSRDTTYFKHHSEFCIRSQFQFASDETRLPWSVTKSFSSTHDTRLTSMENHLQQNPWTRIQSKTVRASMSTSTSIRQQYFGKICRNLAERIPQSVKEVLTTWATWNPLTCHSRRGLLQGLLHQCFQ